MTLATPAALLLLALAAPILWAFLRRPPPRTVLVSSLLLLEALVTAPSRRRLPPPRELLALALFLLALSALVASLALGPDPAPPGRIVLLDTSQSMATTLDGQTRLDAAISGIEDLLLSTGTSPITLVTTAPAAIQLRESSTAEVLDRARALEAGGEDGDVGPLIAALCAEGSPLLAVATEAMPLSAEGCTIRRIPLPDAGENRGITSFTLRAAGAVALLEASLEVATDEAVEVIVQAGDREPTTVTMTPHQGLAERIFRISLPEGGTLSATIVSADAWPEDNTASLTVLPPAPVTTRLVTSRPDGFLAEALRAHPEVSLEVAPPGTPGTAVDLLVLEDAGDPAGARRVLALRGGLASVSVGVSAEVDSPTLLPVTPSEPLTRYIDPTGLRITTASILSLPDGARPLLSAESGPVAILLAEEHIAAVGWSLSDSDLALRLDFAHLIANVVEWAQPDREPAVETTGVLSRSQTLARVAPVGDAAAAHPAALDPRLFLLLAGMLLVAEWGLQLRGAR